jgi:hypothetical protein
MHRLIVVAALALSASGCWLFPYQPTEELPGFCRSDLYIGGEPDVSVTYEYNWDRRPSKKTVLFYNDDGEEYEAGIGHYEYDGDGKLTKYRFDSDVDGWDNWYDVLTYEGDRQVAEDRYEIDLLLGDRLAIAQDWEYDADGRLQYINIDGNGDEDGSGDYTQREEYVYDGDGDLIEQGMNVGIDDDVERGWRYRWEGGRKSYEAWYDAWDSDPSWEFDISYDEHGNRMLDEYTEPNRWEEYHYDCWRPLLGF